MKVGKKFLFGDGRYYLCIYQKFNSNVSKALCKNCGHIGTIIILNQLFEKWKCDKCGELYYKRWCKINKALDK